MPTLHPLPKMDLSTVWERNAQAYFDGARLVINQGGTSSGKTFSILQLLIFISVYAPSPTIASVMSESIPHLKLGAMRDFRKIMGDVYREDQFNHTDFIYDFDPSPGKIEFFSADNPGKVHGPRRNTLYCNEVINISKPIYDAASVRTSNTIFTDYNATHEFWLMDKKGTPGTVFIQSTYLDAKRFLPLAIVEDIESRRLTDPNWWNVYGKGEVGSVEGLVHPLFSLIDSMPEGGIDFYGLDFGFTNDPTALIHCRIIGDDLYSDEVIYETGLTNQAIVQRMESAGIRKGYDEIFADCAEPKSIDEIRLRGFNIKPCPKGPDSVTAGIQRVNQYRQHWTKRSPRSIKEQRNYSYIKTMDGKITNKPIDGWNHGMDARRYAVFGKLVEVKPQMVLL